MKKITEGLNKAIKNEYRRIKREYGEYSTHEFIINYRGKEYRASQMWASELHAVYKVNSEGIYDSFIGKIDLVR